MTDVLAFQIGKCVFVCVRLFVYCKWEIAICLAQYIRGYVRKKCTYFINSIHLYFFIVQVLRQLFFKDIQALSSSFHFLAKFLTIFWITKFIFGGWDDWKGLEGVWAWGERIWRKLERRVNDTYMELLAWCTNVWLIDVITSYKLLKIWRKTNFLPWYVLFLFDTFSYCTMHPHFLRRNDTRTTTTKSAVLKLCFPEST